MPQRADYVIYRADCQTSQMPVMVVGAVPRPNATDKAIAMAMAERRKAGIPPLPASWQERWIARPTSAVSKRDYQQALEYGQGKRDYTTTLHARMLAGDKS